MLRSMKILLINNGKGWSGGQEHLKDLALELRGRRVEIQFVARAGTLSETRFREAGFPVFPMPYRHGISDLKALAGLVSLLRRERFDIVSINREHDLLMCALAWRLAFPLRRTGRLMMSYHLPTVRLQPLLGAADAIVCISEHVKDQPPARQPVRGRQDPYPLLRHRPGRTAAPGPVLRRPPPALLQGGRFPDHRHGGGVLEEPGGTGGDDAAAAEGVSGADGGVHRERVGPRTSWIP